MTHNPPAREMELMALKALSYADDHMSDSFEMKDVADHLGISYSYFYHSFTTVIGEPYWQYVKRHRLEVSAGLLRHSAYNISEIGDRTGYATVAAYTKAFTQLFGKSPRNFRKIDTLPNEQRTLETINHIVQAFDKKGTLITPLFSFERTETDHLPDSTLFYTLLSRGQDPVAQMIMKMNREEQRMREIISNNYLVNAKVITSTLDSVPVTEYERMSMYAGILIPNKDITPALEHTMAAEKLMIKRMPGGHYITLPVPTDFATAGIPMYEFMDRNIKQGVFKMSGTHFFISILSPNSCVIYIPHFKQLI
ncbi:helix-turn-helix transcriptional regulator [Chitinophaga rhizophila]|uniref:Helix-turn-helix transcriptional regulator n=1 Tax=Chitinophaga rhizophila TaxID=2866212 RepID=A0ABS7GL33_9BACT|nr:helix-turn-helix transcriptional regulator [Chitinophaga rhizophila]MBW8687845.1 helix-turn-helix transcriptional regulator [Chitinophaga rhizophila]